MKLFRFLKTRVWKIYIHYCISCNVKLKNSVPTIVIPGFEWYFTNRLPQGYIFSRIFIHYLKIGRWSLLMKFADDTKVGVIISVEGAGNMILEDPNNLEN